MELLATVETSKEFCSVPLGQDMTVHNDHKNLTCKAFNAERVMRWHLMCEEHGSKLVHLKGEKNAAEMNTDETCAELEAQISALE